MKSRFFLTVSSLIVVLLTTVVADRLTSKVLGSHEQGLVFPRNVSRHFVPPEFAFTVTTNSLGFRDREFSPDKKSKTRIVALGDSFTYGWGVEAQQSWPK